MHKLCFSQSRERCLSFRNSTDWWKFSFKYANNSLSFSAWHFCRRFCLSLPFSLMRQTSMRPDYVKIKEPIHIWLFVIVFVVSAISNWICDTSASLTSHETIFLRAENFDLIPQFRIDLNICTAITLWLRNRCCYEICQNRDFLVIAVHLLLLSHNKR